MVYFNRKSIEIMLEFGKNDTVIKAGSPINFNGEVANDATAIGLLLKDVRRTGYRAGKVITSGVVSLEAAAAASGITLSDAAKSAMSNIEFASGSGSGLPEVTGSGKALVSVNGEWVEQDGYGYTDADATVHKINEKYIPETDFIVEFEIDNSGDAVVVTADKTLAETLLAHESGKRIVGRTLANMGSMPVTLESVGGFLNPTPDTNMVVFLFQTISTTGTPPSSLSYFVDYYYIIMTDFSATGSEETTAQFFTAEIQPKA